MAIDCLPSPIQYHVLAPGVELPEPRPYDYVLAGNGLFKRAETPHFRASVQVGTARVAGLLDFDEYVLLKVARIPARWLYQVLEHARQATESATGPGQVARLAEAMYHFHWMPLPQSLPEGGEYGWRVAVPRQNATAGRVSYRGGDAPMVVMDLHSHHQMGAFFSDTDNQDEQGCRFYAVIGRLYTEPEIRLRLGVYGDFMALPASGLFEGLGPFTEVMR